MDVTLMTLLVYAIIGIVLGLILGPLLKGRGFGWFGNLCLGLLGAFLGGLAITFTDLAFDNNLKLNAIAAAGGCVLFTLIVAILKRR